jgi:hypothetical protein
MAVAARAQSINDFLTGQESLSKIYLNFGMWVDAGRLDLTRIFSE